MNRKILLVICGVMVVTGFSLGIWGYKNKQHEARIKLAQESDSVFNRSYSLFMGHLLPKFESWSFSTRLAKPAGRFTPWSKNW